MRVPFFLRAVILLAGLSMAGYATHEILKVSFGMAVIGFIVSAWTLIIWFYAAKGLKPSPSFILTETDPKVMIMVCVSDEPPHQVVAALAAAQAVTDRVLLIGQVPAHALLAGSYNVPYLSALDLPEDPDLLLGDALVLFPVSAYGAVTLQGTLALARGMLESGLTSISGRVSVNISNPSSGNHLQESTRKSLATARQGGMGLWVPNATLFTRELLKPSLLKDIVSSPLGLDWGRLLPARFPKQTGVTGVEVFAEAQAYTSGSYWFHQQERQGSAVHEATRRLRTLRAIPGALGVILSALKGWPMVLCVLIPAGVSMSYDPAGQYDFWLAGILAIPMTVWVLLLIGRDGLLGPVKSFCFTLLAAPISMSASRFMSDAPKPVKGAPQRTGLRTLAFIGAISLSTGLFGAWLALGAGEVDAAHYAWAALAVIVGVILFSYSSLRAIAARHSRASPRITSAAPAYAESCGAWHPVLIVDYSTGGALLEGSLPGDEDSFLISVGGCRQPVRARVVRRTSGLIAVRTDASPRDHIAWAQWVHDADLSLQRIVETSPFILVEREVEVQ